MKTVVVLECEADPIPTTLTVSLSTNPRSRGLVEWTDELRRLADAFAARLLGSSSLADEQNGQRRYRTR